MEICRLKTKEKNFKGIIVKNKLTISIVNKMCEGKTWKHAC